MILQEHALILPVSQLQTQVMMSQISHAYNI